VGKFVGRAGELQALLDAASVGSRTGPAAALVLGEPGSGKSRLLAEASKHADVVHRFRVAGYEPERGIPLASAAALLRALVEAPEHGSRLEVLLFGAPTDSPLESVRIFEAAHRALRALEPALLTIDDLHWVDERSLALCHYLVRAAREHGQRLTVFGAARSDEVGRQFLDSLAQSLPDKRVTTLQLSGLSREEGIALAMSLVPTLDAAAAVQMWERTSGSPFWLEALARATTTGGDSPHVVAARLRGVGADASRLLGLLAVVGRPLDVVDASELAEWPPRRIELAATQLIARGVAVDVGAALQFQHDLIRTTVLAELPGQTRKRLHRRLAAWLEAEAGDDLKLLREALEHRRTGGLPSLELALRLAGLPRRTLLGSDGLDLLAGIADEADSRDDLVLALNQRVASLAAELGHHHVARERWVLVADRTTDPAGRTFALYEASKASYQLGQAAEAREYLLRARTNVIADDALALELDVQDAAIHLWLEQRTVEGRALAEDVGRRARRLAADAGGIEELDDRLRHAYVNALRAEHEAAMQADEPEAMLHAAEAWANAARRFDEESHLTASIRAAVALSLTGRLGEAEDRVRRARAEAHRRVLPGVMLDAGYWLGKFLLERGGLLEAEGVSDEVAQLARRIGDVPRGRNRVSRLTGNLALHRGNLVDELGSLEQMAANEPSRHLQIGLYEDLALWLARIRGPAGASQVAERLDDARRSADIADCPRCSAELSLMSAEALTRIGRPAEGRAAIAEWDELPRRKPHERFLRTRIDGLLRARSGDVETGVAVLEAAQIEAERLQFVVEALWTRLDVAAALDGVDRVRAADALRGAAALAAEIGSRAQQGVAEQRLRALGVRTWRRGHSPSDADPFSSLTEREREVARLAATGASNPEIAEALFLSRKTVERHVSNVLAKLGVRNRAELASMLGRAAGEGAEAKGEGAHR
jgi:DNA-binding CsgD family transcriptional regulator